MNEDVDTRTSFIDMLLSGQMNLFMIFMMALLLISPTKNDSGNVKSKAEYVMTLTWKENVDCDLDLWVRGPSGDVVWWKNKDVSGMHIERDDTGMSNDTQSVAGAEYTTLSNEENWAMRGLIPGEYVVNVHFYRGDVGKCDALSSKTTLTKINPTMRVVAEKILRHEVAGEELHVMRFLVKSDGEIERVWDEPAIIAGEYISEFDGIGAGNLPP